MRTKAGTPAPRISWGTKNPAPLPALVMTSELSSANDALIAHEVVAMKGELEKVREQLENLE